MSEPFEIWDESGDLTPEMWDWLSAHMVWYDPPTTPTVSWDVPAISTPLAEIQKAPPRYPTGAAMSEAPERETFESGLPVLFSGESPFDHWSRERLVRFAQRCYEAMRAANGALGMTKMNDPYSPYWSQGGTGGTALALCDAVTREVGYNAESGSEESENLYRAFYRTYRPILFADAVTESGQPYFPVRYICDVCQVWNQAFFPSESRTFYHTPLNCPGTPRPMTPDDLPSIPALQEQSQ